MEVAEEAQPPTSTMRARKVAKDREQEAKGAAPTSGNVIYLTEAAVDAAVEESVSQQTQRTTINQTGVPEETQPQHSGTTSEEQGAAGFLLAPPFG